MLKRTEKNIQRLVGKFGDHDRLTKNDVAARMVDVLPATIQHWLGVAFKRGLLDREEAVIRGRKYIYFKSDSAKEIEEDEVHPYVIRALSPCCGHEKHIKYRGNSTELRSLYDSLSWSCGDCGCYVRLQDCLGWGSLSRAWRVSVDSMNPDFDPRVTSVSIGTLH